MMAEENAYFVLDSSCSDHEHSDTMEKVADSDTMEKVADSDTMEKVAHSDTMEKVADSDTMEKVAHSDTMEKVAHSDTMEKVAHSDTMEKVAHSDTMEKVADSSGADAGLQQDILELRAAQSGESALYTSSESKQGNDAATVTPEINTDTQFFEKESIHKFEDINEEVITNDSNLGNRGISLTFIEEARLNYLEQGCTDSISGCLGKFEENDNAIIDADNTNVCRSCTSALAEKSERELPDSIYENVYDSVHLSNCEDTANKVKTNSNNTYSMRINITVPSEREENFVKEGKSMDALLQKFGDKLKKKKCIKNKPIIQKRNLFKKKEKWMGASVNENDIQKNNESLKMEPDSAESSDKPANKSNAGSQSEDLYEPVEYQTNSADSDISWDSDEFDDPDQLCSSDADDDDEGVLNKPLPPTPKWSFSHSHDGQNQTPGIISKILNLNFKENSESDDESPCLPIQLKENKHPSPSLPPAPPGLSNNQIKRRLVIDCIINSEKSYIQSIQRILMEYESMLLEMSGLQKSMVKISLKKLHEILNYHTMFQIALAERVANWDEQEKIGDVFTASFSKSMVLDAYSSYVNSFSAAMENIKAQRRSRQVFREFLKQKEMNSHDRLSIFGLMVKPIQRFPQFIMFLQDLLKYTPKDHHDRKALQLAVTELENLAHKLNERKKESEQQFAARKILSNIREGLSSKPSNNHSQCLIRQDDVIQVLDQAGSIKSKKRRLFMLNDTLICVNVINRERDGEMTERFKHKWSVPIKNIKVKDNAISPEIRCVVKGEPGKMSIICNKPDPPKDDVLHLYMDINEMFHDYTVLGQISSLVSSLNRSYKVLTEELVHETMRDLQRNIQEKNEQLQLISSCSIVLVIPSRTSNVCLFFQAPSTLVKQDWCLDLQIAKLAIDPQNKPSWDLPHMHNNSDTLCERMPAFFLQSLPINISRHFTQVQCAVPVYIMSSQSANIGLKHLWVCSSTESRGQVSIISIHSTEPSLLESFQATHSKIMCVEKVPGLAVVSDQFAFPADTVWMATAKSEILVYVLNNSTGVKREPKLTFSLPGVVLAQKYVCDMVFAALHIGSVAVFCRNEAGIWNMEKPQLIELGTSPVGCLCTCDGFVLAGCGNSLYKIDLATCAVQEEHKISTDESVVVEHMVQAGVGLWVSYRNCSIIRLFHLETLDLLQDVNILSSINRALVGKGFTQTVLQKKCTVSSLLASRGLLWIGTNVGVILILPLPRLHDGVPLVSGRPSVSLHGHKGPVKFLVPFSRDSHSLSSPVPLDDAVKTKEAEADVATVSDISEKTNPATKPSNFQAKRHQEKTNSTFKLPDVNSALQSELKDCLMQRFQSVPNLTDVRNERDDFKVLYGSLLRGVDFNLCQSLHYQKPLSLEQSDTLKYDASPDSPEMSMTEKNMLPSLAGTSGVLPNEKKDMEKTSELLSSSPHLTSGATIHSSSLWSQTLKTNSSCNTVIVVSGGDGYCSWKEPLSQASSNEADDASLLFWMYKL